MLAITTADVKARWIDDEPINTSEDVLSTLVEDAIAIITHEFPTVESRVTAEELSLSVVKMVVASAVIRAVQLRHEYRASISQTQGPFSMSESYANSGGDARRGIYLTEAERELLTPRATIGGRAFNVSLGPDEGVYSNIYGGLV